MSVERILVCLIIWIGVVVMTMGLASPFMIIHGCVMLSRLKDEGK